MKILHLLFESILGPMGGLGVFVDEITKIQALKSDVTILGHNPLCLEYEEKVLDGRRVINAQNTSIEIRPDGPYHIMAINDMMTENLLYHLKNESFDLVHMHDTVLWPIARYSAILFDCPIITSCHLSHALIHKQFAYSRQKRFEVTQEAHAYIKSDQVLTCSKFYAQALREYFWLTSEPVAIPNGVNAAHLKQFDYDSDFNLRLGKGKPVVGFVGRLVPSKGINLILSAIRNRPDIHFIVISNIAPTLENFMPLAMQLKDLEKAENVTWYRNLPNYDPEKWRIMASCNLGIVPSLHEPWGIVADEWAALKVPRIVSAVGGLLEHCDQTNAIMFDPKKESLSDMIRFDVDHHIIDNAYQSACRNTWEKTASEVEKQYEEAIHARSIN